MSDFIRRMQAGTVFFRSPDEDGAPEAPVDTTNAGGGSVEPGTDSSAADTGTAAAGTTPADGTPPGDPPSGDGTPPAASTPPAPDKTQQRMNQLVAERWAERRRAEEAETRERLLQEQLAQTRATLQPTVDANGNPVAPTQPTRPTAPPQDLQAMAAQLSAQNEFNKQVQDEVVKGRGAHQDFDQVASNLQRFGELPRTFVEAAMATGKGAEVMYHLGSDIAEADRILSMPPIQQAVALASLANGLKAPEPPKTISSAPAPVTPRVGGGKTTNTPSLEDPNIPIADFIAMREKQLAAGKKAGARR